jgi:hypothetical protein
VTEPAQRTEERTGLHAALHAAVCALLGYVAKDGFNQDQRYRFAGHEAVNATTREALLAHHLTLVPRALRHLAELRFAGGRGEQVIWVWEQDFELVHTPSGELLTISQQVTTRAGEKAAAIASTAADRIVLLRLLRLSTVTEEEEPQREERPAPARAQHRETRPGASQARKAAPAAQVPQGDPQATPRGERVVTQLADELTRLVRDRDTLAKFWERARERLAQAQASRGQVQRAKEAFGAKCRALGFDPNDVTATPAGKGAVPR